MGGRRGGGEGGRDIKRSGGLLANLVDFSPNKHKSLNSNAHVHTTHHARQYVVMLACSVRCIHGVISYVMESSEVIINFTAIIMLNSDLEL